MKKKFKVMSILILAALLICLIIWRLDFSRGEEVMWGATFSQYYAEELLKLDWKETYKTILNELNFKKLRLVAYWQYLEPQEGKFNFGDLDWQIKEAGKQGKEITLVIGYRTPRWPECHAPEWAKQLPQAELQSLLLDYLQKLIERYKNDDAIKAWQVENEPLLSTFGECPPPDRKFLKKEIAFVKSLDPTRPVMVTDSGELSFWFRTSSLGDTLGTTLYRVVWNPLVGRFKHFLPPAAYALRAEIAKKIFGAKDVIISELQAEPWAPNTASITNIGFEKQTKDFNLSDFKSNLEFAKKTGLKEIYLWGPEWWYWRKLHNDPTWMDFGKTLK